MSFSPKTLTSRDTGTTSFYTCRPDVESVQNKANGQFLLSKTTDEAE